ncbi:TonB-dependent siderophore receptor [Azospirillum sp. BE72]|uniref:TonB-dependent receptor n=1 Tax=Azospirillum sp. BE72 TaxID=2817776 RepID=UPI0028647209|nr:TonB-dependent siderophore receptor [Azospirillum sp. BE72]MDR6772915.1 catecholate siderophore receptor [Azospirillum sp. BE72]
MRQTTSPNGLRPLLAGAAATASLAMTFALPATADAQTAGTGTGAPGTGPTPQRSSTDALQLDSIKVDAVAPETGNVNAAPTGVSRLPETVKDTPRVVNVVPQEIIEQQRATSLEQTLRNVPGITISTGEGNGGQNGDQFRIRGLTARGDIYTDGLKDFGVYTHDVFNTETVQVFKGPSGNGFGVGNSGGVINQGTKKASLQPKVQIDQSVGTGPTYRTTVDINQPLGDTAALRVNGLYHTQNVADRDEVEADRRGIAADLGLGLGTPTTWHLNYAYLKGEKTPDMGQPMVQGRDGIFRPAGEFGLDRSTSYVRNLDRDDTENHILTSTFAHEVNKALSVYNDSRFSHYERNFAATNPASLTGAAATQFLAGRNPALTYGAGGGMAFKQQGFGVQNVTGAKVNGELFGMRHSLNGGLDVSHQRDKRESGSWVNRTNTQTVRSPSHSYAANTAILYPAAGGREASVTNAGLFVTDRVWLFDTLSVQGGLRWDYFRTSFSAADPAIAGGSASDRTWSPSVSLIYEPTPDSSVYVSYSRSYKPIGTDIAAAVTNGTAETPNGARSFDPEQTDLYEIGGKADFLNGRLGVSGAIFQAEKSNTYSVDPATGTVTDGFSESGLGVRVRGFEASISGKVTEHWNIYTNYAYLNGKVTESRTNPALVGKVAPNVPKHNASLWTTYEFNAGIPGKFTVGGGLQVASEYWSDSANTARVPHTFSTDAVVSYEYRNVSVALNGYNLTDHRNYSSAFNAVRAVPASGRTVMLTTGLTF